MRCALVILIGTLAAPVAAQTLAQNTEGRTRVAGNELLVESTIDDPAAVRVGAPSTQNSVGKHSFDAIIGSSRDELVLWQGKQTTYGNRPGGVLWGGIKRPHFGVGDDRAMQQWIEVSADAGVRFLLPIFAPNLGTGSLGWMIESPNRQYRTYQQDDGNLVTYEIVQTTLCPRWSAWTGVIPREGQPPPCH